MNGWELLADEHGVIAHGDLLDAGLGPRAITLLRRQGLLTALDRGWYAVGSPATPEERHVLATRASLRAHQGRAVAGHHSGLLILRLPTYRADLSRVRLSRTTEGASRTRDGLSLGRVVPIEAQAGSTVVPALAVVQHGISSGPVSALVAADAALRRGQTTRAELTRALGWVERHPGSATLGGLLALADGPRESPGETRLAHLLHLMQLPVTPQVVVEDGGFRAVVDFLVDGETVVLEFDGRVKYGRSADQPGPFGQRRSPGEVVWAEKRREDRLRDLGYEVVRVVWSDLDDPVALARRIRRAMDRARGRGLGRSA